MVGALFFSCSKPPLTQAVIQKYNLNAEALEAIQLYTSSRITLLREQQIRDAAAQGQSTQLTQKTELERVEIPKGTPCVVLENRGDHLLVGFESGNRLKSLWFSRKHQRSDVSELFYLDHLINEESRGRFSPVYSVARVIRYENKVYRLADAEMWNAHLLFDGEKIDESDRVTKPKGWRLDEASPQVSDPTAAVQVKLKQPASSNEPTGQQAIQADVGIVAPAVKIEEKNQ